jgi:glycosyltransferase involved in cell wall biosynthesis
MRVALVHDWLDTWRGGENVLAELVQLFPGAELYSLVDFLPEGLRSQLGGKRARTTFLQFLPFASTRFRYYLPLMPLAIESLDLDCFDLILSSSHAVAKGAKTRKGQIHLCYCYTPMRYAWDLSEQYLAVSGISASPAAPLVRYALSRLRVWDRQTSSRVDRFFAISNHVRDRIRRCYGRDSTVIYPPVDTDYFSPDPGAPPPIDREFYVTASRWVPYKRIETIVAGFTLLPNRRLIVIGDGPESNRVRAEAGPNVEFTGELPRNDLRRLLQHAKAFVFAAEEDFGILAVEAQGCGTPVIAYGRGGALETVIAGEQGATGAFFDEQSPLAIAEAVRSFDGVLPDIDPQVCVASAARFTSDRFRQSIASAVERAYTELKGNGSV